METPLPTAEKLKSLNVEESRAKRLERQQARLRDRGGIFRPANRNNNLFDILIQASHRKSPAKGRGRSRSRSVSPQKKLAPIANNRAKTPKISSRASSRKSAVRSNTREPQEDVTDRPVAKKSRGKKKQAVELDDQGDKPVKPKSRSRRVAPVEKKDTAKVPRRRAKKSCDDTPREDTIIPSANLTETKQKGKRKKTDADDGGSDFANPPSKSKKSSAAKDKSSLQVDMIVAEGTTIAPSKRQQGRATSTKRKAKNPLTDDPPIKPGGLSAEAEPSQSQMGNLPNFPILHATARTTKRKAEIEVADEHAESRPAKRQAPTKPPSELGAEKGSMAESKGHVTSATLDYSEDKSLQARNNRKPTSAKQAATNVSTNCPRASNRDGDHGVDETPAPTTKRKRLRARSEVDDETLNTKTAAKKPKTSSKACPQDVLRPKAPPSGEVKQTAYKSVINKESEKTEDQGNRPPKTASRNRKENAAVVKAKAVNAPRNERSKIGATIPAHVKRKLSAKQDNCVSDDEPDPIDFLS